MVGVLASRLFLTSCLSVTQYDYRGKKNLLKEYERNGPLYYKRKCANHTVSKEYFYIIMELRSDFLHIISSMYFNNY
jgi:hypothetical protein